MGIIRKDYPHPESTPCLSPSQEEAEAWGWVWGGQALVLSSELLLKGYQAVPEGVE